MHSALLKASRTLTCDHSPSAWRCSLTLRQQLVVCVWSLVPLSHPRRGNKQEIYSRIPLDDRGSVGAAVENINAEFLAAIVRWQQDEFSYTHIASIVYSGKCQNMLTDRCVIVCAVQSNAVSFF